MTFSTLISAAALAEHIADPAFVVVDCRFNLDDVQWGRREYQASHIPGAVYAHLDDDLAGTKTGANGRHPLPEPQTLIQTLGSFGIAKGMQVVVYDQDIGMYASRLWWLLRWMGHDAVAVLDGGFAGWVAEGRPTVTGVELRQAASFVGAPRSEMSATAGDVSALHEHGGWRLLDARAPERYRGEVEPLDRVAGHIPGAANYFYRTNLQPNGMFRERRELRRQLEGALSGVPADHAVCYCGSGVSACHNLLALEHAGLFGAKLYAGSWSEWSSDPARPIATGAEGAVSGPEASRPGAGPLPR